jgi:lysozyme
MKISKAGLDLIKRFEGYHKELPDGSCTAYQEEINGKLDIPTIGYGCTKGVHMGMVWTREQAEAALIEELQKDEEAVNRLVTVDLNQNQFDCLCSFQYNTGGLSGSTALRHINAGRFDDVPAALAMWNKFNGKVSNGLVNRRAAEIALWLTPVEPVASSYMPQAVTPASPQTEAVKAVAKHPATVTTAAGGASWAITEALTSGVPAVPDVASKSFENASAWRKIVSGVYGIGHEVAGVVMMTGKLWPYVLIASVGASGLGYLYWKKKHEQAG